MNEQLQNQTEFAAQAAISSDTPEFDSVADSRLPINPSLEDLSKKKRKKIIVTIAGLVLLLLLTLSLLFFSRSSETAVDKQVPVKPKLSSKEQSEFESQISEIRSDLEAADPSTGELTLPPVDLEISLFEIEEER